MQQQACKKGMYSGALAKGCELCITGEKSVLFVTGVCPRHCFYCPISDQKWQKDVTYINEWPTQNWDDIATEIRLCKSKGVGITGGDPLARLERTSDLIRKLKATFGKKFHIHLYTSLNLFTLENLQKLYDAGLDEIRCHPDIDNPQLWELISNGAAFDWQFGMEIPAIPGREKETTALISYAKKYVHFININELEYSDTNASQLQKQGYYTKNSLSYGIKGSEVLAKKFLRKWKTQNVRMHYCSASFKDNVQMRRRIQKRAESIKQPYEEITGEGTLRKGVIYLKGYSPQSNTSTNTYKTGQQKDDILKKLVYYKGILEAEHTFSKIIIDEKKLRLVCPVTEIKQKQEILKKKELVPAIVEEYPTYDALEVEIDFL